MILRLRLLRSPRIGPVSYHRLLQEYGSVQDALAALPKHAAERGHSQYEPCSADLAAAELRAGHKAGAQLIWSDAPDYPAALNDLEQPPVALWMLGEEQALNRPCIAIVGARRATASGTRLAYKLAKDMAQAGFLTVSGFAQGIDRAAHDGAAASGSIAVIASGIGYALKDTRDLRKTVGLHGLILSERPWFAPPQKHDFLRRNQLIAALGRAMVVVEAEMKSGSLNAAGEAAEIGREVMAVPGAPFAPQSAGCNHLIREGAKLVRYAQDVLELVNTFGTGQAQRPGSQPSMPAHAFTSNMAAPDQLLTCISETPATVDTLVQELGGNAAQLSAMLTELELSGQVWRDENGQFHSTQR